MSASPASSSSSSRRVSKRAVTEDYSSDEDFEAPAAKRRGKSATTSKKALDPSKLEEKNARREARMLRNKQAAQLSRDRKKMMGIQLEQRVAELEAQLALAQAANQSAPAPLVATPPPTFTLTSPFPTLALSPPTSTLPTFDLPPLAPATSALEEENQTLRLQLQLEQIQTAQLKSRLGSLEDKFARLETFLAAPPSITEDQQTSSNLTSSSTTTDDSSRLIAAEATHPSIVEDGSIGLVDPPSSFVDFNWSDWTTTAPTSSSSFENKENQYDNDLFAGVDLFSYLQESAVAAIC